MLWLATEAGLTIDPASGALRHHTPDPAGYGESQQLVSEIDVRGPRRNARGGHSGRSGSIRPPHRKVTERIRLNVPESQSVKVLEDHAGVLWIMY